MSVSTEASQRSAAVFVANVLGAGFSRPSEVL
jgi:hypothetical protein